MALTFNPSKNLWEWGLDPGSPAAFGDAGDMGLALADYEPTMGEQWGAVLGRFAPGLGLSRRMRSAVNRQQPALRGMYTQYLQSQQDPVDLGAYLPLEGTLNFANWLQQRGAAPVGVPAQSTFQEGRPGFAVPWEEGGGVNWGELSGVLGGLAGGEIPYGDAWGRWGTQLSPTTPLTEGRSVENPNYDANIAALTALAQYRPAGGYLGRMRDRAQDLARARWQSGYTDPRTGEYIPGVGMGQEDPNLGWLDYITRAGAPQWLAPTAHAGRQAALAAAT